MRTAIALLITLVFVMIISVSIGYGLTQLKNASNVVSEEKSLYQNTMLLDDVLEMLKGSPELLHLADSNASEDLYFFLQSSASLPLKLSDRDVILSFESARSKLNINTLNKSNEGLFRSYFSQHMIGESYLSVLKECMSINQAKEGYNNQYTSALFDENPELFRDYIASKKHLDIINDFYIREYGETHLKEIPFEKLFSYGLYPAQEIDLNYISPDVWELILDVSKERAIMLAQGAGNYHTLDDLDLSSREQKNLKRFRTTFFAPELLVKISIVQEKKVSNIYFRYDIKQKRGYDFVFEL